ncbi:MAG: methylated-DNA--[protein]-cysteine S-methyltransferase, partial [Candidatus Cryptobacteroides sp.]
MDKDSLWVVVRIYGRIASVSADYRALHSISGFLAGMKEPAYREISVQTVGFDDIWALRQEVSWDSFILFGTEFQKRVWREIFCLAHKPCEVGICYPEMVCYSEFASRCGCPAGVRAVAHAVSLNPVAVLIPCHLIVPKDATERMGRIRNGAESTIFKGEDLCLDSILSDTSLDFGEYALGRELKRELIRREFGQWI